MSGGEAIKGYPTQVRERESAGWVLHSTQEAMGRDLAAKEKKTERGADNFCDRHPTHKHSPISWITADHSVPMRCDALTPSIGM